MEENVMVIRLDSGVMRFGLPGLVLGLALSWVMGTRGPEVSAQTGSGPVPPAPTGRPGRPAEATRSQASKAIVSGETGGTLALLTNAVGPAQWLYLIDTKKRAFAVYRIDPTNSKGTVKLEASRQYRWDLELEQFNNSEPAPSEIEAMVRALARSAQ
jgi:hypothetical protein